MKTKEDYQKAIDALSKVCKEHGIFLVGTDDNEGVLSEITLFDADNPLYCGFQRDLSEAIEMEMFDQDGCYCIDGIK